MKRALVILEVALGANHLDFAKSLGNLALLYLRQGRYSEAEPLDKRDLVILEKVLGADHPDVAGSLNNLAELYRAQGRNGEAEPLLQRALSIRESVAVTPAMLKAATSAPESSLSEARPAPGRRVARPVSDAVDAG